MPELCWGYTTKGDKAHNFLGREKCVEGSPIPAFWNSAVDVLSINNSTIHKIHPSATVANKLQYTTLILLANSLLLFHELNFLDILRNPC